jgi:hypothetical protein
MTGVVQFAANVSTYSEVDTSRPHNTNLSAAANGIS